MPLLSTYKGLDWSRRYIMAGFVSIWPVGGELTMALFSHLRLLGGHSLWWSFRLTTFMMILSNSSSIAVFRMLSNVVRGIFDVGMILVRRSIGDVTERKGGCV